MLYLTALLGLLASCDKETVDELAPQEIRLGSTLALSEADTRTQTKDVQKNELADGQPVGVYVYYTGNTSISDNYAYENISYTVSGTGGNLLLASGARQPYYPPKAVQVVDIYAFSPRTAWASVTSALSALTESTLFSVSTAQGNDEGYKASDFVWGKTTSSASQHNNQTVTVPMNHKLSKIIVNVQEGNGMSGRLGGATVKLHNTVTNAKINLTTGRAVANDTTKPDITIGTCTTKTTVSGGTDYYHTTGVIVPQTLAKGTKFITVTLSNTYGNTVYTYNLPSGTSDTDKAFTEGNVYTYTITVHATAISLTTDISPWTDAEGGAGSAIY